MKSILALALITLAATAVQGSSSNAYLNVYGETLQPCSYNGTALTGFTRNGYCIHKNDDDGSHHICIDVGATTADDAADDDYLDYNDDGDAGGGQDDDGDTQDNFCTITGQSDWCSNDDLPCHEDSSSKTCAIGNWCVCQRAFASYIRRIEEGCDQMPDIQCESTNLQAVRAYVRLSLAKEKYAMAVECLASRCGLDLSNDELYGAPVSAAELRFEEAWSHTVGPLVVLVLVLLSAIYILRSRQCMECSLDACVPLISPSDALYDPDEDLKQEEQQREEHLKQATAAETTVQPKTTAPPGVAVAADSFYRMA